MPKAPGRVEIDTGDFNPVLGHSYGEIAGMSRSMHRSQGMGSPEAPRLDMVPCRGRGRAGEKTIFDGVDTTWNRIPGGAPVGELLAKAGRSFEPAHPEKVVPRWLKRSASCRQVNGPLLQRKQQDLDETIALCAGLWVDATADEYDAAPGRQMSKVTAHRGQPRSAWSSVPRVRS